jgi:hypothetical protein
MKIFITNNQLAKITLNESLKGTYGEGYSKEIKSDKEAVFDLLRNSGRLMIANDNDKLYRVYYLQALSKILGREYVICRLVDVSDFTEYGSIYVKPLNLFREYK